jgi:UDP-N-acetyl-D-mannosaminuronate dehydrogenase
LLESTIYPGTTEEIILPILENSGLKVGKDIFLAFAPERIDPGSKLKLKKREAIASLFFSLNRISL